jgi:hypothetical protein
MGLMPPYDPLTDPSLSWVIGRVHAVVPAAPTWADPASVTLEVEEVLRAARPLPARLALTFGPPREAAEARFYAARGLGPPPWTEAELAAVTAQNAALDATPIEVPEVGARIAVWVGEGLAGDFDVPSLRAFGPPAVPMRSRWVEAKHVGALRARLAHG